MNQRQIPNLITFSRLLFAIVAFWFMDGMLRAAPEDRTGLALGAFWFYAAAGLTDALDGFVARRYQWVTALGRVADPVVDKVLTLGAAVYLAAAPFLTLEDDVLSNIMPVWGVVILLAREFLVTALRGLVESKGMQFPADRYGKIKMILQTTYILVLLGAAGGIPEVLHLPFLAYLRDPMVIAILFWLVIALTVLSGLLYCIKGASLLSKVEW